MEINNKSDKFDWVIESNYIYGHKTKINKLSLITHVYIFDLDWTIIKTKSGKTFPTNKNDWELLYPEVEQKLENSNTNSKKLIGIITNQGGLKNRNQIDEWTWKIEQINKLIKIDFVFASLSHDQFRKPMDKSWEYIKLQYTELVDWSKLESKNKIYYIGDAFGRIKDFSDTDYKFAFNCKMKFKTPELFFKIIPRDLVGSITYPIISYYSENIQNELFKNLFDNLTNEISKSNNILIIMIGLPGSGKTFMRNEIIKKMPQFSYTNNDEKKKICQNNYLIDDNTNVVSIDRVKKLELFKSHYKIGIWFDYKLDVCWHLNLLRMYWFGTKLVPKVSYNVLNKKMAQIKPTLTEGFDYILHIDKIFYQINFDSTNKYYF